MKLKLKNSTKAILITLGILFIFGIVMTLGVFYPMISHIIMGVFLVCLVIILGYSLYRTVLSILDEDV